jgi:acetoacetyl-CoA synthetase
MLRGTPLEKAANIASVDSPEALHWYAKFAANRLAKR